MDFREERERERERERKRRENFLDSVWLGGEKWRNEKNEYV